MNIKKVEPSGWLQHFSVQTTRYLNAAIVILPLSSMLPLALVWTLAADTPVNDTGIIACIKGVVQQWSVYFSMLGYLQRIIPRLCHFCIFQWKDSTPSREVQPAGRLVSGIWSGGQYVWWDCYWRRLLLHAVWHTMSWLCFEPGWPSRHENGWEQVGTQSTIILLTKHLYFDMSEHPS